MPHRLISLPEVEPRKSLKGPSLRRQRDRTISSANTRRRMPTNGVEHTVLNTRLATDSFEVMPPKVIWSRKCRAPDAFDKC
jgi:hypothetical protein